MTGSGRPFSPRRRRRFGVLAVVVLGSLAGPLRTTPALAGEELADSPDEQDVLDIGQWLERRGTLAIGPDGRARALIQPEFQSATLLRNQLLEAAVAGVELVLTTPLVSAAVPATGPRPPPEPSRLLLVGEPAEVRNALGVLARLDVPERSVEVTALVCEVRTHVAQQSGGTLRFDQPGPDEVAGTLFRSFEHGYEPSAEMISRITGARPFEGHSLLLGAEMGSASFASALRILSRRGEAAFLAQPLLVCTQGRTANMEVLREIPFPVIDERGLGQSLSVLSVQVGLRLGLHALQVSEDGAVLDVDLWLRVPEESEDAASAIGTLVLRQRHVTTRVVLKDQAPVLLGGLYLRRAHRLRRGLPGLRDVVLWVDPLLSARETGSERTEILLYLQARPLYPRVPNGRRATDAQAESQPARSRSQDESPGPAAEHAPALPGPVITPLPGR